MDIREAYDTWSSHYDTNENKTRDLEGKALRQTLAHYQFDSCLEIGCGTGKNTVWLSSKAAMVKAIDLSEGMLAQARQKIQSLKVSFEQADILKAWSFADGRKYDLVVFSLVLEHIRDLNAIFAKLTHVVAENGWIYIGELHPFKQYQGTKARYQTSEGTNTLTCIDHHISDFTTAAVNNGFSIIEFNEFFDDLGQETIPRILVMVFQKKLRNTFALAGTAHNILFLPYIRNHAKRSHMPELWKAFTRQGRQKVLR